jgi:2-polyprenyl-3-methyl-5-hydroxy-6-metoxy-1,4-benzoquinol methylase
MGRAEPLSGRHGPKRKAAESIDEVQAANRGWWEATPMSYDWNAETELAPGSERWFAEQDRRSAEVHRLFATDQVPFDRLIPYGRLAGRQVLEIGCGSGYHSELLARAGAAVTGIDLTSSAVALTRRRFELRGLSGGFRCRDAEQPCPEFERRFDFVWSWGVVHHSSMTARIVRNVATWVKPEGRFAGMVYHRHSTSARVAIVRDWLVHRNLRRHSVDEALWHGTDGYSARFYSPDQWRDLLLGCFDEAEVQVAGVPSDVLPLPRRWRSTVLARLPESYQRRRVARVGSFLLFAAGEPLM